MSEEGQAWSQDQKLVMYRLDELLDRVKVVEGQLLLMRIDGEMRKARAALGAAVVGGLAAVAVSVVEAVFG